MVVPAVASLMVTDWGEMYVPGAGENVGTDNAVLIAVQHIADLPVKAIEGTQPRYSSLCDHSYPEYATSPR